MVEGWLRSNGVGVFNRTVATSVNGTLYTNATNQNGYFSLSLDLQPRGPNGEFIFERSTYTIQSDFKGDTPASATAYSKALDGASYVACTTLQYGFKPCSNSTVLVIDPQSTGALTSAKSPEEMQKEAQDGGWLSVYSEFSWWSPWFRLHVRVHINPAIDIGFNPILPGGETWAWEGLERFWALTQEALSDIGLEMAGLFVQYILARTTSIISPWWSAVVEALKIAIQTYQLVREWNDNIKVGSFAIVNIIMGLVAINTDIAASFLLYLCRFIAGSAMSVLKWIVDKLLQVVSMAIRLGHDWVDWIEILYDFLAGGLALGHYYGVW